MTMKEGERQVAPARSGIRRDHVARYEWVARRLPGDSVIDLACGVGYGSQLLAQSGKKVAAIDKDADAIAYALAHYAHKNVEFRVGDASSVTLPKCHAAVCFETVEHIKDPLPLLKSLRGAAKMLFASVPNEDEFPWRGHAFHFRHYTKGQFEALLNAAGWKVVEWHGQAGPESGVTKGAAGRTLIAVCERGPVKAMPPQAVKTPGKHISILGLGPSVRQFLEFTKRLGGRHAFCDEVWTINALGDVFASDVVFHMDDVRVQEIRAEAAPGSNIARMVEWLRRHPGPVVTSYKHPDYPGLVEFPLADVLALCPSGYFNSTAAYAVAYAIFKGATKISVFGADYTYPDAHDAEKGRACVEFWLGVAASRGIEIVVPKTTTLLDAIYPMTGVERFYGYDGFDLKFGSEEGRITVAMTPKALPTAEEVERNYDHSRHPNAITEQEGQS